MSSELARFLSTNSCWHSIFNFLDYKSRARCQASCRSLSILVDDCWKAETFFDFSDVRPPTSDLSPWPAVAVGVCSQIGNSLLSLKMCVDMPSPEAIVNGIVAKCPNIERIDCFVAEGKLSTIHFDALLKLKEINLLGWENGIPNGDILANRSLPKTLQRLTGLRGLRLDDAGTLRAFLVQHPNLRHFEMSRCDFSPNDAGPGYPLFNLIAEYCPRIERLAVSDCASIDLDGVESLSNLVALNVRSYSHTRFSLTEAHIHAICSQNPRLESLLISGRDEKFGDGAFSALAALSNLQELEISGTRWSNAPKFTDASFRTIIDGVGVALRRLCFHYSPGTLSDKSIDTVGLGCPNLRVLVLNQWPTVFSAAALRRLIDSIVLSSANFDPAKDTFLLCLDWDHLCNHAAEYAALVSSTSLPAGAVVRRFDQLLINMPPNTIVPVMKASLAVR